MRSVMIMMMMMTTTMMMNTLLLFFLNFMFLLYSLSLSYFLSNVCVYVVYIYIYALSLDKCPRYGVLLFKFHRLPPHAHPLASRRLFIFFHVRRFPYALVCVCVVTITSHTHSSSWEFNRRRSKCADDALATERSTDELVWLSSV